ncbi:hypothetical protein CIB48_g11872 [Xylaria polymorpha]|nr:hypothetical protein CIB48_g11872 [Xylaria polymorpha]
MADSRYHALSLCSSPPLRRDNSLASDMIQSLANTPSGPRVPRDNNDNPAGGHPQHVSSSVHRDARVQHSNHPNRSRRLSFANFTGGFNISVLSSPALQILSFPDLVALQNLTVVSAPSLTQISLPKLAARAEVLVYPVTYSFTPAIAISDAPSFGGLSLPSLNQLGDLTIAHVPRRSTISGGLEKIASVGTIQSDNYLAYPGLTAVGTLQLTGYEDAAFFLPNLSSVAKDFAFANAVGSRLQTASSLTVGRSFVLDTTTYPRAENETTVGFASPGDTVSANVINVGNLTSVGANATIRSNANAHVDVSGLTTVSGTFSITNNTNCSIDVTKLSQVGSLSIVDNVDSTIPQLFNLARAESIHLRGNIDTSSGPNILPSLTFVSGSVTIEAWNSDFNCSRLVAQQQQGLINTLSCNGTSSSPSTPSAPLRPLNPPPSSSTGLSTGAQAGIGVGVSIVVLGLIGGAIWAFLYFRRRVAALEEASRPLPPLPPPKPTTATTTTTGALNNASGISGGFTSEREPQVHEADNSTTIVEKPAYIVDISHELYVPPAELPVTQHPRGFR